MVEPKNLSDDDLVPGSPSPRELEILNGLIDLIRHLVLAITLSIWTVLGFLFWIPMLFYSIMHFSALVVYATLVDADPQTLATRLERSVRFYLQGFHNIIHAVYKKPISTLPAAALEIHIGRLLIHVSWTLVFWLAITVSILAANGTLANWMS